MVEQGANRSCHGISNHTATTSSDEDVEEDMLIEILSRLPTAASAIRLKLVCKRWCSLISTPCFIRTFVDFHNRYHDSYNYQKPFGFLLTQAHPLSARHPNCAVSMFSRNACFNFQNFSLSGKLPWEKHDISVLESCNNLILCWTGMMRYFLCNPFTKQWVALPSPTGHTSTSSKFGLVCDPYCVNNPHYRIVHFVHDYGNLVAVETYHSETGQWVKSNSLVEVTQHKIASNIVAYNGKLCWIGAGRRFLVTYDPFNMGSHCTITLMSTEYQPSLGDDLRIGVSGGVLRIITEGIFDRSRPYQVWDVEELVVDRKWTIRLKHFNKDMNICSDEGAMHPTNKDLVYFYTRDGGIFREYNMESREIKASIYREFSHYGSHYYGSHYKIFPVELPWWPIPVLDRSSATLLASEGPKQ